MKRLSDVNNDDEKKKLMEEHDAFQNRVNDELNDLANDGALELETRTA